MRYLIKNGLLIFVATLFFLKGLKSEKEILKELDDSALKCDACKIIARRFGSSFKSAEKEIGGKELNEDEYIEAAEATCDEDWNGYGVQTISGVQRLVGLYSDVEADGKVQYDSIWERRLQDFCDELLSDSPDEKTLYRLWLSDITELEKYLCEGKETFKACVKGEDFGTWPGDDYEDYDDVDFDFIHDEF